MRVNTGGIGVGSSLWYKIKSNFAADVWIFGFYVFFLQCFVDGTPRATCHSSSKCIGRTEIPGEFRVLFFKFPSAFSGSEMQQKEIPHQTVRFFLFRIYFHWNYRDFQLIGGACPVIYSFCISGTNTPAITTMKNHIVFFWQKANYLNQTTRSPQDIIMKHNWLNTADFSIFATKDALHK